MEETSNGKIFPPNRSKKNIVILYVVCGLFFLLGILLASPQNPTGYYMAIFAFVLFLMARFITTPPNVLYSIGEEGIRLRGWTKKHLLSFSEIESVNELKEDQAERLMLLRKKENEKDTANIFFGESGKSMNPIEKIISAFKKQAKSFAPYKFMSVPIAFRGKFEHVSGANLPCDCVFILLKNGEGYLISPLDTEGFVKEAKKHMQ
ncbi:MAG: hypothetical protein HY841_04710 [Bacteroidetes bacterium]|nr:hypothetical protein [Bacteroidota bacterium]